MDALLKDGCHLKAAEALVQSGFENVEEIGSLNEDEMDEIIDELKNELGLKIFVRKQIKKYWKNVIFYHFKEFINLSSFQDMPSFYDL